MIVVTWVLKMARGTSELLSTIVTSGQTLKEVSHRMYVEVENRERKGWKLKDSRVREIESWRDE